LGTSRDWRRHRVGLNAWLLTNLGSVVQAYNSASFAHGFVRLPGDDNEMGVFSSWNSCRMPSVLAGLSLLAEHLNATD
jgi:hypothetical protein